MKSENDPVSEISFLSIPETVNVTDPLRTLALISSMGCAGAFLNVTAALGSPSDPSFLTKLARCSNDVDITRFVFASISEAQGFLLLMTAVLVEPSLVLSDHLFPCMT